MKFYGMNGFPVLQQKFLGYLTNKLLSDNDVSDDGLSLSASVAVNKQILEVIRMPGNDPILVA